MDQRDEERLLFALKYLEMSEWRGKDSTCLVCRAKTTHHKGCPLGQAIHSLDILLHISDFCMMIEVD